MSTKLPVKPRVDTKRLNGEYAPFGPVATAWGERIKNRRNFFNWTRDELGLRAGISDTSVWRYEVGRRIPNDAQRVALAIALEMEPDMLFPTMTGEDAKAFTVPA